MFPQQKQKYVLENVHFNNRQAAHKQEVMG